MQDIGPDHTSWSVSLFEARQKDQWGAPPFLLRTRRPLLSHWQIAPHMPINRQLLPWSRQAHDPAGITMFQFIVHSRYMVVIGILARVPKSNDCSGTLG